MKIVAFAGSNSSWSINRQLVRFALSYFAGSQINLLDLNDFEMPIFSVDREEYGYPPQAYKFMQAMEEADIIICSLAENNRSYSTAFKNVFDWCSRIDLNIFKGKPMLLMSTSPGGYGGGNVMNAAKSFFPSCGADIKETFSLPRFDSNFNRDKGITDPSLRSEFESKINIFKQEIGVL
jgi:NAD(P)H-dependent FMN reductase